LNDFLDELYKKLPSEPDTEEEHLDMNFKPEMKSVFFSRRFRYTDKIVDLKNFAKLKMASQTEIILVNAYDKTVYDNEEMSLKEAGFKEKATLLVKELN
jgi:hypothetical protein